MATVSYPTPLAGALASQLERELRSALIQAGSARVVDGVEVEPELGPGTIVVSYDQALTGAESTLCDGVVANTDPANEEIEATPSLPIELNVGNAWVTLASVPVAEGRVCVIILDLRARFEGGGSLDAVRVQLNTIATREVGGSVTFERPEVQRKPGWFRAEMQTLSASTLELRVKSTSTRTLKIGSSSTLEVISQ